MADNSKKKIIVLLVGIAVAIVAAIVVFRVGSAPSRDAINTNINDSWRRAKGSKDSTSTEASAPSDEIATLFADIERARNATDGWPGMHYGLLQNIKRLDELKSQLDPEQTECLNMYKQEYPDWEEIED